MDPKLPGELLDGGKCAPSRAWIVASVVLCGLAVLAYFTADQWLVRWVHERGIDAFMKKDLWWLRKKAGMLTWPGNFLCTLVIATAIALVRRPDWRPSVLLLLSGVISGSNSFFKWIFGRSRPDYRTGVASMNFEPFRGGIKGLFGANLSFPSGDTALAAATAACLCYLFPKGWWAWWSLAAIVALQRIAENAHHASDVLAATALGIASFHLARGVCAKLGLWPQAGRNVGGPASGPVE